MAQDNDPLDFREKDSPVEEKNWQDNWQNGVCWRWGAENPWKEKPVKKYAAVFAITALLCGVGGRVEAEESTTATPFRVPKSNVKKKTIIICLMARLLLSC